MTLDDYNAFCATLPATSHVVQWGGAHVWKIGGEKIFAVAGWAKDKGATAAEARPEGTPPPLAVTFKVTPLSYDVLKDQPGLRPAPYLASRGMKWIQHYGAPGLSDEDLKAYLRQSHQLVCEGFSKKKQQALGL